MTNPVFINTIFRYLALFLLLFLLGEQAFAQQTYRLSKAPFYKTFAKNQQVVSPQQLIALPVTIDKMTREEFFYEGREQALQPVITAINRYLDSLNFAAVVSPEALPEKGAPYLFVGSSESVIALPGAEMLREEYDKFPPMSMHLGKPGSDWKTAIASTMNDAGGDYMLVFWIGFNEYPKANKGLFKKKVVLGTDYEPEIRFLSGELELVEVLQVTGLMLDKTGNVIRAGAEAFLYEDSPFWVQMFGARTSIDDKTLAKLVTDIRREDLPGSPPAWKVAIYNLIQQLTQLPKNYTTLN